MSVKRTPKRRKKSTVDWDRARLYYIEHPEATYQTAADEVGSTQATVAKRAGEDNWRADRQEYQAKLLVEMLQQGIEDKKAGARGLIKLQYNESMAILMKMQNVRKRNADGWRPQEFRAHVDAFEKAISVARQALGLPKDFAPEQRTGDLAPVMVAWLPQRAINGPGSDSDS